MQTDSQQLPTIWNKVWPSGIPPTDYQFAAKLADAFGGTPTTNGTTNGNGATTVRERIASYLKGGGATILQVASALDISRGHASSELSLMRRKGLVKPIATTKSNGTKPNTVFGLK